MTLNDGVWLETPGTGDKMAAWWHFENKRYQIKQMVACPGIPPEEVTMEGVTYDDIAPGCYDPIARLADMDINHVEASLCFPNYPRFCGQLFSEADDLELGLLCVQAYNDWMIDEWCGSSGGRLIPLCIVPLWDAELAAKEIYRVAEKGCRAVAWSELPAWLGRPGLHGDFWDPFLKACEETQTVICMHIGSGTKTVQTSPEAPTVVTANLIVCNSAASMIDWIFSGKFEQFPNLKLLYAESQIGWIPYFIERADDTWRTHQWAQGEKRIPKPPSHYYKKHVYSCFFKDTVGIDLLDRIGEDNVLFETDYPHQDGTFPNTLAIAEELFGHLEQETIDKIARNNAIKLFGLTI
jgi:predicted TIM-barrel fold metal-dependent hydrolase